MFDNYTICNLEEIKFDIMFEDDSDCPYSITTKPEFWDRSPADEDQGWNGKTVVFCKGSEDPVIQFDKVYYRRARILPCLAPVGWVVYGGKEKGRR